MKKLLSIDIECKEQNLYKPAEKGTISNKVQHKTEKNELKD